MSGVACSPEVLGERDGVRRPRAVLLMYVDTINQRR